MQEVKTASIWFCDLLPGALKAARLRPGRPLPPPSLGDSTWLRRGHKETRMTVAMTF